MAETKSKEEFREEQRQAAASQNLPSDNAVPETRPQAWEGVDDSHQSRTYLAKRKAGELEETPMPKSAYDKAASEEQARQARRASRREHLLPGTRVRITRGGPDEGRNAYVDRVNYASVEDERIKAAGNPESRFAEVESYTVRTRDGRPEILELAPDELRVIKSTDWGRGEI